MKNLLKIVVSAGFVIWLALKVDLPSLVDILFAVRPGLYLAATGILLLNSVILAAKYKLIMTPSGISQTLFQLIKINFICRYYSMFLTTAVGQGVIRWHISTKNQAGRIKFISVMLFERSSFVFALLLAVMLSSSFITSPDLQPVLIQLYPFLIIGILAVLLYYLYLNSSNVHRIIRNLFLPLRGKTKYQLVEEIINWLNTDSIYFNKKKMLAGSIIIAFIWQFFFLVRVYLLAGALGVTLGFNQIAWMASIVLILQLIPVTLNGIGLREGAYAFLFGIQGLPAESGAALGLLLLSHILLMAVAGGLIVLLFDKQ